MRVIVHGPANHIFSRTLLERSQPSSENLTVEIIEPWHELLAELPKTKSATLILINKTEKEALEILNQQSGNRVLMCRGGEKEFQPTLTLIRADKNHQHFLFESWDDFMAKVKKTPLNPKPLLSASSEADIYRVNYENFPELAQRQKKMVNQKFFWFSVYFSKIFLRWFSEWVETVMEKKWPIELALSDKGKIKKLILPFNNMYKGELIFREGEDIKLSSEEDDTPPEFATGREAWEWEARMERKRRERAALSDEERERCNICATVRSSDEESLEIVFKKTIPKKIVKRMKTITKDSNILQQTIEKYRGVCSGYADLSQEDYIYLDPNHYNRPEDFLRGYIPNHNKLHLPIHSAKLDGPSKAILYDESQMRALTDMLGPSFVSLIEGGPGTGKTLLTAVAVKQLIRAGRIVLLTSHSNKGLDNLLESLADHVDNRLIFRLGNNPDLISSEKIKKLHRYYRFEKQREAAKKEWEKENKKAKTEFDEISFCLNQENNNIWQLICSGKTLVLAATVNSAVFDKQLGSLYFQNNLINEARPDDFEREDKISSPLHEIPKAVVKYMKGDSKKCRPFFTIDVTIIDEATKARLFELIPIIKKTDYKLILIGDTDQLGNINIAPEAGREMLEIVKGQCQLGWEKEKKESRTFDKVASDFSFTLTPEILCSGDHALSQLTTTRGEIEKWFAFFSEGAFSSLIKAGHIASDRLNVNRRSLEEITKFLNHVFRKKMAIGRFNPYSRGSVSFLDITRGEEERVKTSYKNRQEKILVVKEVINFFERQKRQKGEVNLKSLGVITTYRGQTTTIKERLRKELLFHPLFKDIVTPENIDQVLKEMVNTVDAFQGSEKEGIILSLVRANSEGRIGFSTDLRRIYVALSRARTHLVIIGSSRTFLKNQDGKIKAIFGRIINFTQSRKTYGKK